MRCLLISLHLKAQVLPRTCKALSYLFPSPLGPHLPPYPVPATWASLQRGPHLLPTPFQPLGPPCRGDLTSPHTAQAPFQPLGPPCSSSSAPHVSPQGLSICSSLCPEALPPNIHRTHTLSLQIFTQTPLAQKGLSKRFFQTCRNLCHNHPVSVPAVLRAQLVVPPSLWSPPLQDPVSPRGNDGPFSLPPLSALNDITWALPQRSLSKIILPAFSLFPLGSDFAPEPGSTGRHHAGLLGRLQTDILFLWNSRCQEPNVFPPPPPPVKTQKFSDLSSQPQ